MDGIVDRERELRRLREFAAAPPGLVILTGRRRVGKSFLLRVALTGDRVVHFQAEEQPRSLQLEAFARECALLVGGAPLRFDSWEDALSLLDQRAREDGPVVVALDEFQYLAREDPVLVSSVQKWWDRWDREQTPVLLVLAGSALSFMTGLLAGNSPTHGRSAFRPVLQPLDVRDAAAFAPGLSPVEQIERFAVLGGTPQYQRWAGRRPLGVVLREIVLPPDSPLHRDPEHLIREEGEIRDPGPYFGTLAAVASGYTTPTAIGTRLQAGSQLVHSYLRRLEELGYLGRIEPVEPACKGRARAFWRIRDPYFRFWFTFVLPNRSRLARGRIEEVAAEIEASLASFVGPLFEDVCREWLGAVSPLGARVTEIGSWWSRRSDTEIDVATLAGRRYTLLGECKWWDQPVGENILDDLIAARRSLGPAADDAELILFAKRRFTATLRRRAEKEGVHLVTAADVFA